MPIFNLVKVYGEDVAKVLEPGERLLAMGYFHTNWGGDTSRMDLADHELRPWEQRVLRETGQRPSRSTKFVEDVDWMGVHVNRIYFDRWLYGSIGHGAIDSHGGRLWRVIRDSKRRDLDWIVTDRRLAFLHQGQEIDPDFKIVYSVPRSVISHVKRRGKLFFQWGRCELHFIDGSMCVMLVAVLDVIAARILVRALSDDH